MNRTQAVAKARRVLQKQRKRFVDRHEDCFTVEESAKKYHVDQRTVRRWISEGMPSIKDDKTSLILIRRRDIERHILYS